MYVVTVKFRVDPARLADFMPLMVANARDARERENGCRQFDVCRDPARPEMVLLYELYDDRAAFEKHLQTPHFQSFDAAVRDMVVDKVVRTWERIAP
jgi:quinol monooxygenase YgiN